MIDYILAVATIMLLAILTFALRVLSLVELHLRNMRGWEFKTRILSTLFYILSWYNGVFFRPHLLYHSLQHPAYRVLHVCHKGCMTWKIPLADKISTCSNSFGFQFKFWIICQRWLPSFSYIILIVAVPM